MVEIFMQLLPYLEGITARNIKSPHYHTMKYCSY